MQVRVILHDLPHLLIHSLAELFSIMDSNESAEQRADGGINGNFIGAQLPTT